MAGMDDWFYPKNPIPDNLFDEFLLWLLDFKWFKNPRYWLPVLRHAHNLILHLQAKIHTTLFK